MAVYLVRSLVNLRREIDARWPNRDRRTDGWFADPRLRASFGHNPDFKGAVHAIDVDKDGINPDWLISHIYKGLGVLWYIIWNRRIWTRENRWVPQTYTGRNPHTDHLHIEVMRHLVAENYFGRWGIAPSRAETIAAAVRFTTRWGDADPRPAMNGLADRLRSAGGYSAFYAGHIRNLRR